MSFKCTCCGHNQLEEVMEPVVVISECWVSCGKLEYGETTNEYSSIDRYQCKNCGSELCDAGGVPVDDCGVCVDVVSNGTYLMGRRSHV